MGNDNYQYTTYSKSPVNSNEWKKETARQHRIKIMSIAMITLECIIGIGAIFYFATQLP